MVALGVFNEARGTEDVVVIAETTETASEAQARIRTQISADLRHRLECMANDIQLVPHMWLLKSSSGKIARSANRERYLAELKG